MFLFMCSFVSTLQPTNMYQLKAQTNCVHLRTTYYILIHVYTNLYIYIYHIYTLTHTHTYRSVISFSYSKFLNDKTFQFPAKTSIVCNLCFFFVSFRFDVYFQNTLSQSPINYCMKFRNNFAVTKETFIREYIPRVFISRVSIRIAFALWTRTLMYIKKIR